MLQGVTIDGDQTRDIDDAIWFEREGQIDQVTVSVTNVPLIIKKYTRLDREALAQGFTHYIGQRAVKPMLPRSVSEARASLLEGEMRNVIAVELRFEATTGELKTVQLKKEEFRSVRRLTYEQAAALISAGDEKDASPLPQMMNRLFFLASGLNSRRRRLGSLVSYSSPNSDWAIDEEGNLVKPNISQKYASHRIIEEFSILTNFALAKFADDEKIPFVFRNHKVDFKAQDPAKGRLGTVWKALHDHLIEAEENYQPNQQNPGAAGLKNAQVARLWQMARREMIFNRAKYSGTRQGHDGLALEYYAHSTSPLRRYSDLINLRQINAVLEGKKMPYNTRDIEFTANFINRLGDLYRQCADERERLRREQNLKFLITDLVSTEKSQILPQMTKNQLNKTISLLIKTNGENENQPQMELETKFRTLSNSVESLVEKNTLPLKTAVIIMATKHPQEKRSIALEEAQQRVLGWVEQDPSRALQMWEIYKATGEPDQKNAQFETVEESEQCFRTTGLIKWEYFGRGEQPAVKLRGVSVSARANRKQESKALAAYLLWKTVSAGKTRAEIDRVENKLREETPVEPKSETQKRGETLSLVHRFVESGDFMSALNEYATRLKVNGPQIVKESLNGPAHQPRTEIELCFKDADHKIFIGTGEGASKQKAKMQAAAEIYQQLCDAQRQEIK